MYQNCCKKCGSLDLHTEISGNNTGLYCSDCGAWIKWLGKGELRAFENSKKEMNIKQSTTNSDEIQCAACGNISSEKEWFNSAVHNKFKICPRCGTVRFLCDDNRSYRR